MLFLAPKMIFDCERIWKYEYAVFEQTRDYCTANDHF